MNCIFCEIALGNAPAQIVHRTPEVLVIVPIEPVVDGHLLVLPQKHSVDIFDTTSDTLAYLMTVTKQMSEMLRETQAATGVNVLHASGASAQQSVGHFHLHVIPRFADDGLDLWIRNKL